MGKCIFCKIANGEQKADIIFENDKIVVFKDINPKAPVHLLIVPRKHIRSINNLKKEDNSLIGEMIFLAKDLAKKQKIDKEGYRLMFCVEKGGGQSVFHLHLHLYG
ncbi:MAG: histidine triad nucleotide-binding protein [Candidatus Portnoybacteria bacterium]